VGQVFQQRDFTDGACIPNILPKKKRFALGEPAAVKGIGSSTERLWKSAEGRCGPQ
jgi:hypothetical protein